MTSMDYYRGMLLQPTRIEAFRRAIREAVRPGDAVVEIGAGLGTYALFAAQAGAAKVYAVEGGAIIAIAKEVARANGLADRVEFIRGWFPEVDVPGPADVLIFEDYSPRLLDQWTFGVLRALHRRVIGPGTRLVPTRARVFVAPVQSAEVWRLVGPLGGADDAAYGVDWSSTREYICNTALHMPIVAEDLRHEPRAIAEVALADPPNAGSLAGTASWTFQAETAIHGIAYWFDLDVGGGEWLSNAPGGDPRSWGNLFLPMPAPLVIPPGGTLEATVAPEVRDDGAPGWLTWRVVQGARILRGHEFQGFPATLDDVLSTSPSWVPTLSEAGKWEREVLRLTDGKRSVDDIARELAGGGAEVDAVRRFVLGVLARHADVTRLTTSH